MTVENVVGVMERVAVERRNVTVVRDFLSSNNLYQKARNMPESLPYIKLNISIQNILEVRTHIASIPQTWESSHTHT